MRSSLDSSKINWTEENVKIEFRLYTLAKNHLHFIAGHFKGEKTALFKKMLPRTNTSMTNEQQ